MDIFDVLLDTSYPLDSSQRNGKVAFVLEKTVFACHCAFTFAAAKIPIGSCLNGVQTEFESPERQ